MVILYSQMRSAGIAASALGLCSDKVFLADTATSEALGLHVEQCKLSAMFPTYLTYLW